MKKRALLLMLLMTTIVNINTIIYIYFALNVVIRFISVYYISPNYTLPIIAIVFCHIISVTILLFGVCYPLTKRTFSYVKTYYNYLRRR